MSSEEAKTKTKDPRRRQIRYVLSDDCRLKASIKLRSADPGTAGKDWPGTVVDMSAEGAHIQISLGAVAYVGDTCVLTLSHSGLKIEMRGSLAHYVCSTRNSVCGVRFDFSYGGSDKAYHPFFKAIVVSSSLAASPGTSGTESSGRYREEYRGAASAKLVIWRDKPGGAIVAFDYIMARFGASLGNVGAEMFRNKEQVRYRAVAVDGSDSGITLARTQELDARWEFSLAASNLPKEIPADVRRLLRLVS